MERFISPLQYLTLADSMSTSVAVVQAAGLGKPFSVEGGNGITEGQAVAFGEASTETDHWRQVYEQAFGVEEFASMIGRSYSTREVGITYPASPRNLGTDFHNDDNRYRQLKMKYFRTLKVVPPLIGTIAHSAPTHKGSSMSLRSNPIAIPEKTRRVDDFFYKSPAESSFKAPDDPALFDLEL